MFLYLIICFISIFAGLGILSLFKTTLEDSAEIFLAPLMTMVLWIIFLGWALLFRFTVMQVSLLLWGISALLAVIGLWHNIHKIQNQWYLIGTILIIPTLLMFPYFIYGIESYTGSWFFDGWAYITHAQYLWRHQLGQFLDQNAIALLAPVDKFAAIHHDRFADMAIIAFFSQLTSVPGDTQAASGLFLSWGVFVFASTCALFILVKGKFLNRNLQVAFIWFATFSCWMLNVLIANNYSNLLAISFLPGFCGIIYSLALEWKKSALLSMLSAALLYLYPEMAPAILGCASVMLLHKLWQERSGSRIKVLLFPLMLIGLTILLIAPWLTLLRAFFASQLHAGLTMDVGRPGEGYFPGLLDIRYFLISFWGFCVPLCGPGSGIWSMICHFGALLLTSFLLIGTRRLWRAREWPFLLTTFLLFCGALIMIFHFSYDYGAYKFILLSWWAVAFCTVSGVDSLRQSINPRYKRVFKYYLIAASTTVALLTGIRVMSMEQVTVKSIGHYKQVTEISGVVRDAPVLVNVSEPLANQWALFFLRNMNLFPLGGDHPYFQSSSIRPDSKKINFQDCPYLLTDASDSLPRDNLLWAKGPYFLWRLSPDWCFIANSKFPAFYGMEDFGGRRGFWLGNEKVEFTLFAKNTGLASFDAEFYLGPSLPEKHSRRLLIAKSCGIMFSQIVTIEHDGWLSLTFPVSPGENRVTLEVLDRPSVKMQPNGDPRALLLAILGLRSRFVEKYDSISAVYGIDWRLQIFYLSLKDSR